MQAGNETKRNFYSRKPPFLELNEFFTPWNVPAIRYCVVECQTECVYWVIKWTHVNKPGWLEHSWGHWSPVLYIGKQDRKQKVSKYSTVHCVSSDLKQPQAYQLLKIAWGKTESLWESTRSWGDHNGGQKQPIRLIMTLYRTIIIWKIGTSLQGETTINLLTTCKVNHSVYQATPLLPLESQLSMTSWKTNSPGNGTYTVSVYTVTLTVHVHTHSTSTPHSCLIRCTIHSRLKLLPKLEIGVVYTLKRNVLYN